MTWIIVAIAFAAAVYHLAYSVVQPWPLSNHSILHVGIACVLVGLSHVRREGNVRRWLALAATVFAVVATPYVFLNAEDIDMRFGLGLTGAQMIAGGAVILAAMILCWLEWGGAVASFSIAALLYFFFGHYLSGPLAAAPQPSFEYAMTFLVSGSNSGVYGQITPISANVIFPFMLFGGLLSATGVTRLFFEIGNWFSRYVRGGAAAGAVVSSSLLGTVIGATVANVAIAGTFTIPAMKKQGFRPQDAAAIETVASCGGQILPPVMGVGAFVMASYLGVPYIEVAAMALVPAVLYYASILICVFLIVRKNAIARIVEPVDFAVIRGQALPFLIPLCVLVYFLVRGFSPTTAVTIAIGSVAIVTLLRPSTWRSRLGLIGAFKQLANGLIDGARQGAALAVVMATTSLLAQSLITTAMGPKFASAVALLVYGNIVLGLVLVMFAALVLGIGLPTVAAYIMAAIMLVPALNRLGLPLEAAHMFAFYFAVYAAVTPPAAEAAQVASRIAETSFWGTAASSMRLMVGPVLIPYVFALHTALLTFPPNPSDILLPILAWFVGTFAMTALTLRHAILKTNGFDVGGLALAVVGAVGWIVTSKIAWLGLAYFSICLVLALQFMRAQRQPPHAI
jgi:TRAP transporter 4TM/12TM fusion protein